MTENNFSQFDQMPSEQTQSLEAARRLDLSSGDTPVNEALETLRLLAELPPPGNLEEHVYERLSRELAKPQERGFWSLWKPVQRLQYAAVAVLMAVIAVTGWTVMRHGASGPAGMNQPVSATPPVAPATSPSGFSNAGAERRPTVVKPIKVPPAPRKKPGASHLAKPIPKADTTAP